MNKLFKKSVFTLFFVFAGLTLFISAAQAEDNPESSIRIQDASLQTAEAVYAYWTAERMEKAIPMPLPVVEMPADRGDPSVISVEKSLQDIGQPGYAPGWAPGSGLPQPDPTVTYIITEQDPRYQTASDGADFQTYGSAPSNPLNGPYSPFQRWSHYQNYTKQATATIGKLFFTKPGIGNYVCSASVIGQRTICTAAHCMHSGKGGIGFYTNWLFCPSYYKAGGSGGPHPSRGCWSWVYGTVSSAWVNTTNGNVDRDYGCLVTALTGDTVPNKVGNVTGWTGRAWNWSSYQPMVSWGYPAGSPFPGYHIILATSPEWYEVDMVSGDGQVSKYMGNDMTGGSSGGPWWMSVKHWAAGAEYKDIDGFASTDPPGCPNCVPGGPYINGVNSHRRCRGSCFTPPTATAGTFWQEMGSAQFRGTSGDTDESEDICARCYAHE
jgi:V8-like Glu-specific endopeptidase